MASLTSRDFVVLIATAVVLATLYIRNRTSKSGKPLPGPPGVPFFGNMFEVRKLSHPQIKFTEWAQQYGDIFSLELGPRPMIVVSSPQIAETLLGGRSRIYSGRPTRHVAFDIMSAGQRLVAMPYNKTWRITRKNAQAAIGSAAAKNIRGLQELESRVLLKDLMDNGAKSVGYSPDFAPFGQKVPPEHWFSVIRRYTTSVVLNATLGKRIDEIDSATVRRIFDTMENFTRESKPGKYLADVMPIMRKLPDFLAPWRLHAQKLHEREVQFFGAFITEAKSHIAAGRTRENFFSSYLASRAEAGYEDLPGAGHTDDGWMRDKLLTYLAVTLLEAGSDTTASSIQSFVLYMLASPDALRKARDELDDVVGPHRLPVFDDEPNLPYVVACIKEAMRLHPVIPLGVPHSLDEDDEFDGYFIPKGSMIVTNFYAMHRNPEQFPDPCAFRPERHYQAGRPTPWRSGPDPNGRENFTFGFGRRFCVGYSLAEASLFIVCARIVWGLDLIPDKDEKTGQPRIPDVNNEQTTFVAGSLVAPRIFPVIWKARDATRAAVIEKEFEAAQDEWAALGMEQDKR